LAIVFALGLTFVTALNQPLNLAHRLMETPVGVGYRLNLIVQAGVIDFARGQPLPGVTSGVAFPTFEHGLLAVQQMEDMLNEYVMVLGELFELAPQARRIGNADLV
jgi:hypothetical protein